MTVIINKTRIIQRKVIKNFKFSELNFKGIAVTVKGEDAHVRAKKIKSLIK